MKQPLHNRILALVLAAVMVLGQVPAVSAAPAGLRWEKSDVEICPDLTDRLAEDIQTPSDYQPSDTVRVSIVLEEKSTLQAGFSTISIAKNTAALAYNADLQAAQRTMEGLISARALGGAKLDVVWNMTLVGNIISANVPYGKIEAIQAVDGVAKVVIERQYSLTEMAQPQMNTASAMTGAATVWTSGYTGAGSRVAIIDTGTDTDHQSFDNGAYRYALEQNAQAAGVSYEEYAASLDLLDAAEIESVLDLLNATDRVGADAADYYISEKLPFGANYVDCSLDVTHDNDPQGSHGSHVAGIAAANRYIPGDGGYVDAMEAAGMNGVAPDAQIITLKVFGKAMGPYDSDYFAAVEDAIWLGADSVNLSLGSSNPGTSYNDAYADLLEYLETTDTVVVMSAGNSGYWAQSSAPGYLYTDDVSFATGGVPGSYHSALAVASVDNGTAGDDYTMSDFSSWGVPGNLSLKPELTAPGGSIWSIDGMDTSGTGYELMSGTSMAAPQVTGMAALVAEYIRDKGLEENTSLSPRHLAQSLLMSTAQPLREEAGDYYALMNQGAGLARVDLATSAESYILVDGVEDGKVKVELGEDADRTGTYSFSFSINNLSGAAIRYALSADLFTQDILDRVYLDTGTRTLPSLAAFTVDGVTMEAEEAAFERDLNGDGVTDEGDADFLLEYLLGNETEIHADADINGDGTVTSYDAHLLLTRLGGDPLVEVPANGSVTVDVTLKLTDGAKSLLDANYPSGAYVEAFVYAAPVSDGAGVIHSIPVLGFYGSWSEPGMYDVGSYLEHASGQETRTPYLYRYNGIKNNYLTIDYGDGTDYIFGGNPIVEEDEYLPRRNAFNNESGAMLSQLHFGLIRNAAASRLVIENAETGEIYLSEEMGEIEAAYYHVSSGSWQNSQYQLGVDWDGADLPEGTVVNVSLVTAPELYRIYDETAKAYTADWSRVEAGGWLTTQFTVDNTEPQVLDVALDSDDATVLNVTAKDNQYIAAVAVMNAAGTSTMAVAPANQTAADTQITVQMDLREVFGSEFLVAVYDYAGNVSAYEITLELEDNRPYFTAIDRTNAGYVGMETDGNTITLAAAPDREKARAAEYVDGYVYEITDDNKLYVGSDGDLNTFTWLRDLDPEGQWEITGFNDLAYNPADGKLYGNFYSKRNSAVTPYLCTIDLYTGEMTVLGAMPIDANSMTIDGEGNFYSGIYNRSELYTYTSDVVDTQLVTCVGTMGSYSTTLVNSMAWDHNTDELYWACTANNRTYLLKVDPATAAVEYLCYYRFAAAGLYIPGGQGAGLLDPDMTAECTVMVAQMDKDRNAVDSDSAAVTDAEGNVTVSITLPADAANGTMTVRFDADAMEFVSASSTVPAFAWAAGEGSVEIAFASRSALPADSAAAVLTFTAKASGSTAVTVATGELNDGTLDHEETISVSLVESCGDGLTWTFGGGVLTISGQGAMNDFEESLNYNTAPWREYGDEIIQVVIEEGVTTIGRYAFNHCTRLTAITIPASVTSIGSNSFTASGLTEITFLGDAPIFDDGRNSGFPGGVFYNITATAYYPYGNETWTEDVLQDYTGDLNWVPYGTGEVVASGWSGYTTWTLTDDGLLTFFGEGAMKNYTTKTAMPWYDYLDQIEVAVLRNGITTIGSYAFYGMPALEKIYIPDTVTNIGGYAFKNSTALDGVVLPEGLTQLGESAFFGCTSLTAIDIPASLWTVRPYTFKNCTSLAKVTFHEGNLQKISDAAFYNTALVNVVLPECLDILDVYVFKNCANLLYVTLPSALTEIREAAFYGTGLGTVTIPAGITKIGPYAFKNCKALRSVFLPASLDSIGDSAFYGCGQLCGVEIPEGLATIGAYAFKNCGGLYEITLPTSLTTLADSAFYGCDILTEITIPENVETVGAYCFSSSALRKITFTGDAPSIGKGAFNNLTATAYYPGSNITWTAAVRQNYGGAITWTAAE